MRLIARMVNQHINSVRSTLIGFIKTGICVSEQTGKKIFFQANQEYEYYDELLRLSTKETGLGARIIKEKMRLGKIKLAFVTANYYKHTAHIENNIDLLVVGTVSLPEIEKIAAEEGEKEGREINYSVMNSDEFAFRKKNKDPFLQCILQQNRLVLLGKEDAIIS